MQKEYKGHIIKVTDDFRFMVTGPDKDQSIYTNIDAAVTAIEQAVKSKFVSTKVKVKQPVLLDNGKAGTITGIHMKLGTVLGLEGGDYAPIYPPVPWIQALLRERAGHVARAKEIERQLTIYVIKRGWGRDTNPEDYEAKINKMVAEIETIRQRAEAAEPKAKAS